jgi:hypothetical protein
MISETPLARRMDKSKDVFDFLSKASGDMRSGKLKLKDRGAANTRELAKAFDKKKKRKLKTFKQFHKDKAE